MHSSSFLESAPVCHLYFTLVEPAPEVVNSQMTWTEASEQQLLMQSPMQQPGYSIPEHLALPGVVLLLILIFHNGRNLLIAWHVALRRQYHVYHTMMRSRRIETLERIFHQDSSRK